MAAELEIDISDEVIYCSIEGVDTTPLDVERVLSEGTELTFRWQIVIEEDVDYWVDQEIGSITFTRRVVPDIVLRQWLLEDESSGIVRRTLSITSAADFLTSLKLFPVIDRSLIHEGGLYHVYVKLYVHEGTMEDGWWQEILRFSDVVGSRTFELP